MIGTYFEVSGWEQRNETITGKTYLIYEDRRSNARILPHTLRREYANVKCLECGIINWERVAEIPIPPDFKVNNGSRKSDVVHAFGCSCLLVSTRLKEALQILDDSLKFQAAPNDDFFLVVPTCTVEWDPEKTSLAAPLSKHCQTCGKYLESGIKNKRGH